MYLFLFLVKIYFKINCIFHVNKINVSYTRKHANSLAHTHTHTHTHCFIFCTLWLRLSCGEIFLRLAIWRKMTKNQNQNGVLVLTTAIIVSNLSVHYTLFLLLSLTHDVIVLREFFPLRHVLPFMIFYGLDLAEISVSVCCCEVKLELAASYSLKVFLSIVLYKE